jgi:RHS repeat-associated protein
VLTSFTYSDGGLLLTTRQGDGVITRYGYDGAGNITSVMDPNGQVTRFVRGGLHLLCEVIKPNGEVLKLSYDREGRLVQLRNSRGEVHVFERNAAGLTTTERTFDGRVLRYRYDPLGRLIHAENGSGQVTENTFDLAGQLVKRTYGDDSTETLSYDLRGELTSAVNPAGEFTFERNAIGWITREVQDVGGESIAVETDYDAMGDPVRRRTSRGHVAEWTRDIMGRNVHVRLDGQDEFDLSNDMFGHEVARSLPRGGRIETQYDELGRLEGRRVISSAAQMTVGPSEPEWVGPQPANTTVVQAYRYTAASQLAETWDRAHGLTRFEYDPAGQLLAALPASARAEVFRYDDTGNLFATAAGADPRAYGPGDRLLRKGGTEYRWDAAARLVESRSSLPSGQQASTRYTWSATGLLEAVERPDGVRVEFAYDPFARRVAKRVSRRRDDGSFRPVQSTRFVWDGATLVHEIKRSAAESGDPIVEEKTYCFEDDRFAPWAHRDAKIVDGLATRSGWFHYLNDPTGAPERLVDADGEIACELIRGVWGDARTVDGAVTSTALRFPGQYADEETGLSYNRYRYYDASLGRFISADPAGIDGGMNVFAYSDNRPTSSTDRLGLASDPVYAVIKKPNGDPLYEGSNTGGKGGGTEVVIDKALPSQKPCAETDALSKMARDIRAEKGYKPDENHEEVRAEIKNRFEKEGLKIEAHKGSKGHLDGPANPCSKCKAMYKELGIEDHVNAPNRGKKMTEWDKKSTF